MAGISSASDRSRELNRDACSIVEAVSSASTPSPDNYQDVEDGSAASSDKKLDSLRDNRNWTTVSPSGNKPRARYYHAAAVVGRKMLVIGGDSDLGMLNDVQQLHLGKLTWSGLGVGSSNNGLLLKTKLCQQLPACRGHSVIAWGKTLLLITGETDRPCEKVAVWSFDIDKESWSLIEAKGEIPVARTGHSVTKAGSVLILFGGEDAKGRKLNDLHMFDIKSLMWLPLHATGTVPSARAKHVAAMYDDRLLLVFGGLSKSRVLNDLHSLDFETMEWSRLKTRGISPGPRAECAGVLFGGKWYIAGGESNELRCMETIMLDIARMTWCTIANSSADSPLASQGFSMVLAQRKERTFLVAFGGKSPGPTNEVQVLHIRQPEHSSRERPSPHNEGGVRGPAFAKSTIEKVKNVVQSSHDFLIADNSGALPLYKRFLQKEKAHSEAEKSNKNSQELHGKMVLEEAFSDNPMEGSTMHARKSPLQEPRHSVAAHLSLASDMARMMQEVDSLPGDLGKHLCLKSNTLLRDVETVLSSLNGKMGLNKEASDQNQSSLKKWKEGQEDLHRNVAIDTGQTADFESKAHSLLEFKNGYEKKLAAALRKNAALEMQFKVAVTARDEADKNLSSVIKSRQKAEKRLAISLKEIEDLKKKLSAAEIGQEESNNLTNVVHAENLRLDHDLAFFKAVLEDTQKELHTTRGVLSGERSRAFQLQVELFELKQTLQVNNTSKLTEGKKLLSA